MRNKIMIRNLVPKSISPSCPNPGRREMVKLNFYFHTSLWCLKRFLKAFIKPFEASQRSVKFDQRSDPNLVLTLGNLSNLIVLCSL